ncbi:restriction endonuclease subunit S [Novosphingobium sp. Fuku2-ISO-50]|uniref:restriction endonuclease subunit S n=1 Tax=Novosphingobium sp. Fuku2-ISO-50 TaxID=1739114 RepID=UPI000AD1C551|nr:restriction endonuclease subunit S [Novosphingobium sp. Fuku2-ISO-50]
MSSDAPHDWPLVALGSLARVKRGASPRPIQDPKWFSDEGHGWVRISDVTASDRVLLQTTQYLSDAGRAASVEIIPGDLIMSICATIGRPLFSGIHACIHDGFVAFKQIDRSRLDPTYLYFVLQGLTLHFEAQSQPGTQRNLNSSLVGTTEIPLPPLEEQWRIAEVLRSVDEAITATQDVIVQLREVRSHRLDAFMALPGEYKRIEDVCRLSGGNGFPIKHQGKSSGRYPFAKVSDMNRPGNEVLMRYAENYVDDADLRALKAKTFPVGTTFFPKVGATLLTNKRRIAAVEMLVDNNVMGAVATSIDPWFLYYAFCTIDMADYVQPGAVPSVNQRTIGQIMIPVPSKSEQEGFAQSMRDLDLAIEAQSDALGQLRQSKAMVAADLLSGQVRVPA